MKKIKTVNSKQLTVSRFICLCLPFALLRLSLCIVSVLVLSGCATEYYPPRDGEKQGAIKRKGFVSWSDGVGKNLPLANPSFSVIGK